MRALVFLLALPCVAQIANNSSQTYDSGKVTCVAGTTSLMYTYGDAGSAALGTYSAKTYSAVPGEPVRTMAFCYNTADGLSNKNRTIIVASKGGNIGTYGLNANCLWCVNFDEINGSVASWLYGAVEGTQSFGVHYNVIFPQYTFSAAGQLSAAQTDTTSGPGQINNINGTSFWPLSTLVSGSSPYVLHFATGEKEEITATTGALGPNVTVTGFVRGFDGTTATTHTTSEVFWVEDANGVGIGYPGSICDLAVLAAYLSNVMGNGSVPGTKDQLYCLGWSNGGFLCQELNQVGHSILKNGSCNSDSADNGFVIQKIAAISSKPDMGATTTMTTWSPSAPSPYNVTADGSEPNTGTASTGWNTAGFPAYSSITLTSPYAIGGLPATGANAGYTQAQLWSPQFNQPGNCLGPVGCDPNPGPEYLVCGQKDTDVSCLPQHVFGTTTLIPTILSEQASVGHTANFDDNNGVGTGCGASGNSQACANGAVMQAIMRFFASGGVTNVSGATLTASPESVTFNLASNAPGTQTVTLTYQSDIEGTPNFQTFATTSSGTWLTVSPGSGTMTESSAAGPPHTSTATVTITADPTRISPGTTVTGTVTYVAAGLTQDTTSVTMNVATSAPRPIGVANAASAAQATAGVVAPGSYVAIYGTGLAGGGNPSATSLPLPTTLNGTKLLLGGIPMPLLYASPGQVNALVPQAIAPNASYPLVVITGTSQSAPFALTIAELQPGVYTTDFTGSGAGIVTNALTNQLIGVSNPAHATDYLTIYCTGLGALVGPNGEPEPADGAAAPTNPVFHTTANVTATIGGVSAPVSFSGLTATLAALYQVNVQVPSGVTPGNAVPIVITAADLHTGITAQSNPVTIMVQ